MKVFDTPITGLKEIEVKKFGDERGFFFESYNHLRYCELLGLDRPFVQDNVSFSRRGVLRGLHFQNPKSQGKLVSVLQGEVYDVAVDIRVGSPTFGKWHGVLLSDSNQKQFWVPHGFAHGFVVLSESALFSYKCDAYYSPADERSLIWSDPELAIDWKVADPLVSPKDASARRLREFEQTELPKFR